MVLMKNTRFSRQILMKLEFSRQIFERYLDIKFHDYMSRENRVVPFGPMGIRDEANNRFSQFCDYAEHVAIP